MVLLKRRTKRTASIFWVIMVCTSASAGSDCMSRWSDVDNMSGSTARTLLAYVKPYWDIAVTEKPDRVSVSLVEDPSGDGSKIDFHEAQFKSFQADFYRYIDGTPMPSELSTTSTNFKLPCGLKVGQPQAKVRVILGAPTYVQSEVFVYATGGDQNGEVTFLFKRGRLSRVIWRYDTH